jgi:hypothetical protein
MKPDPSPASMARQETNSLRKRCRCAVCQECIDNQIWDDHLAYLQELGRLESQRRQAMSGTIVGQDQQATDRQPDLVQLEFEQMDGKLEASVIFAAAGKDQYQNGALNFGDTALADAQECYQGVITRLYKSALTGERRQHLDEKVNSVRQLLAVLGKGRSAEVRVTSSASAVQTQQQED